MKLSAILVSVNIAATLPIAASGAACAQEEAKGATADWLKSNLSSVDTSVNQKNTARRAGKVSFSKPVDTPAASNSLKLRPFVAHRKLPSQRDLDMQLIAQTAKMAAQQSTPDLSAQTPTMAAEPAPLSGRVAEVYQSMPEPAQSGYANVETYGSVGYVKQSSSRVVPGQVPSVPGQIRQFKPGKRPRYVPPAKAPSEPTAPIDEGQKIVGPTQIARQQPLDPPRLFEARVNQMQPRQWQPCVVPPDQMPAQMQFQPPPMSPDEQAIIDRMVDRVRNNGADSPLSDGAMSAPQAMSSAGPPPFPLNLLPQDSLKQLINGRRDRVDAPPSYFGSWHGQKLSCLPPSGFQSYARSGMRPRSSNSHYMHSNERSRYVAHSTNHSNNHPAQAPSEQSKTMSQLRRLPAHDISPAAYSPYARLSGGMSSSIAY